MSGKIQNEDVKSESELTGAGGSQSQLINDTKIYVTASGLNKRLDQAIAAGDFSGGGGGGFTGVNIVTLDSSYAQTKKNNYDAESTVGDWAAYSDAAGSSPVDMTGGSPTVAVSRTTTSGEFLDGAASFKIVKDAANRQGEGVSVLMYIPPAYRNQTAQVVFPFKIISGSIASGDILMYAYDVTNTTVVTPSGNTLPTTSGIMQCTVAIPSTCAQMRIGFHFATTSTTAVTLSFDDFIVQVIQSQQGPRSEVFVHSGNGYGSTNTKIRRYSTVQVNTGSDITYADSATLGSSFTINTTGVYSITRTDGVAGSVSGMGASRNSTELTTNVSSISIGDLLFFTTTPSGTYLGLSGCFNLTAGDVIRPHDEGLSTQTYGHYTNFRITKVSN